MLLLKPYLRCKHYKAACCTIQRIIRKETSSFWVCTLRFLLFFLFPPSFQASPHFHRSAVSVCQSSFGSTHSYLSCIFISVPSLQLHSLQPNKVWIQGERVGEYGGKTIGTKSIFPQMVFGLCFSASMNLCVTTQWRTKGQKTGIILAFILTYFQRLGSTLMLNSVSPAVFNV